VSDSDARLAGIEYRANREIINSFLMVDIREVVFVG
jgi:hypothetical protein